MRTQVRSTQLHSGSSMRCQHLLQRCPSRHAYQGRSASPRLGPGLVWPVPLRLLQRAAIGSGSPATPDSTAPHGAQPQGSSSTPQQQQSGSPAEPPPPLPPPTQQQQQLSRVLQVPLELAATLSIEDAHYLQKQNRSKWWSKAPFPMVEAGQQQSPPPLQLWQKVLPLGIIFFAASFNLTILQNLKDAIMVTKAGAETLPWLASCVVLPASLGFFMLYGRLVENLPQQAVFYAAIAPLLSFYVLFAAVLYPAHASLHPHGLYEALAAQAPVGLHGLLKVVENWTFSLFFCAAELWGSVVISVLFWSLANEVCTVEEARSVYPLMGIAANVALVLSGSFVKAVCKATAGAGTHAMLSALVASVVVASAAMAATKAATDRWVVAPYCSLESAPGAARKEKKKKEKGSFGESLAALRASPKIANLAILVMSYGVTHRLFEFAWKGQLRVLYPTPSEYQGVLADVSIATGWATICMMLVGKFVFQYLGWGAAAMATPFFMGLTGAFFFFMSLAANQGISLMGMDPRAMAFAGVAAGALTQIAARSAKFSLFDSSKEMVWIEMSKEEKLKGKAAVDLLGSQIGKSGGAWITQLVLLVTGSIASALPFISAAFVGVCLAWVAAVSGLGRLLKQYEEEKVAAAEAAKLQRDADAEADGSKGEAATKLARELQQGADTQADGKVTVTAAQEESNKVKAASTEK